jgi:hypothetical protein
VFERPVARDGASSSRLKVEPTALRQSRNEAPACARRGVALANMGEPHQSGFESARRVAERDGSIEQ